MVNTKLTWMTTKELVQLVLTDREPTEMELELVSRIELLEDQIEDLENDVDAQAYRIDDLKLQLGVLG